MSRLDGRIAIFWSRLGRRIAMIVVFCNSYDAMFYITAIDPKGKDEVIWKQYDGRVIGWWVC